MLKLIRTALDSITLGQAHRSALRLANRMVQQELAEAAVTIDYALRKAGGLVWSYDDGAVDIVAGRSMAADSCRVGIISYHGPVQH